MATVKSPYLDAGVAAFEELDTYKADYLLLGTVPPLQTWTARMADNLTLAKHQVCGLDANGRLVPATLSTPAFASRALTFTAVAVAAETVTIGGVVYTFRASLNATPTANEVLIGTSEVTTAANLAAAINHGPGEGVVYGTPTLPNPNVTATSAAGVVTVTARQPGPAGNAITIAEASTVGSWAGAATVLGGGGGGVAARFVTTTAAVSVTDAVTMPVYYSGNFNIDALVWDSSFTTDAQKLAAFMGAPSPSQFILGKR